MGKTMAALKRERADINRRIKVVEAALASPNARCEEFGKDMRRFLKAKLARVRRDMEKLQSDAEAWRVAELEWSDRVNRDREV